MLVSVLLLPLVFAVTGMRTRLDLLTGGEMWLWAGVVLVASVCGKMGGAIVAARWTGQSWNNALALGALLNTRGLVELVVLNIAYKAGVFSAELFTMLVLMALVTTAITTPLLDLLGVTGVDKELQQKAEAAAA
jgi:Kef-type K+ transport system membrane component KefB